MNTNININLKDISTDELIKELKTRGYKATKIRIKKVNNIKESTSISSTDNKLFNPVITYRDYGETLLRNKLDKYTIEELIKICKAYTPDINYTIYRCKNKEKVIKYIITRSSQMSRIGQAFRTAK